MFPLNAGVQDEEDTAQHLRSGSGFRPGYLNRRSFFGSSSSIRSHKSSDTIHGEAPMDWPTPNAPTGHGHQDRFAALC